MAFREDGLTTTLAASPERVALRLRPQMSARLGGFLLAVAWLLVLEWFRVDDPRFLAAGCVGIALGRGLRLGRPVLAWHAAVAFVLLVVAAALGEEGFVGLAELSVVGAGFMAVWPPARPAPGTTKEREHLWTLVDQTSDDSLAPFALRKDKSYVFAADGRAAVAYRVRFGVAVAAGDPVGDPRSQRQAAQRFVELARAHGWRIAALGAGEEWGDWWRRQGLRGLCIGREVVVDVQSFGLAGRTFRNLRQAVQRTRNAGVTTEIHPESELPEGVEEELRAIVRSSGHSSGRGFAMILDGLLDGGHPGTFLTVARDSSGTAVAFQRYATADGGREVSQDLTWRAKRTPNGVDERMTVDTIEWARSRGARRVSLSFAAFPDLFEADTRSAVDQLLYFAARQLDPLIRLESLYRYLRKFHALQGGRFAMLRIRDGLPVAAAMLLFEFGPRARWPRRK